MEKLFIVAYASGNAPLMQYRVRDENWIRALLQVMLLTKTICPDAVDFFEAAWAEDFHGLRKISRESGYDFHVLEIGECDG